MIETFTRADYWATQVEPQAQNTPLCVYVRHMRITDVVLVLLFMYMHMRITNVVLVLLFMYMHMRITNVVLVQ